MPIDYGPRPSIRLQDTRGENSRTAKLTEELVCAMRRERPARLREWLRERDVPVCVGTAQKAIRGATWTHLPIDGVRE